MLSAHTGPAAASSATKNNFFMAEI